MNLNRITAPAVLLLAFALSACSAERAVDRTVDSTLWVGKTAVKGTVGAGKMVVRGGHALVTSEE
ncbi:hypothetical protein MWU52_08545 [Jannaschia sp. S6380]|uniref:hypothetical protein n=1 Tax=Jannaschia sp. S6380 TaxID=2926408 RepID=UPI001FF63E6C|nr:hypothetical protein [Jannaschia sp. S6380]MCK0167593.1 hypothetical protein [Jannaschia sp. S6380]